MSIHFKATAVVLEPVAPSAVPNGAIFLDITLGNALTVKSTSGLVDPIGTTTGGNMFIKQMQTGGLFPINAPVSKQANGTIILADSDAVGAQEPVGFSTVASTGIGQLINVLTVGANIAGAVTGMGFLPGDEIFVSETGGFTNNTATFTGLNDSYIRLGIADCAAGIASSVATDLIVSTQILLRP
jgi:hypothetical protein